MRLLHRTLIALFCVWHMTAVLVYAVPDPSQDQVAQFAHSIRPIFAPYMYVSSQWQQWNLFSPDPLRRVTEYYIDSRDGDTWTQRMNISNSSIGYFRVADEMTIIRKFEELGQPLYPVFSQYLAAYCTPLGIKDGTDIRLRYRYAVLPKVNPGERLDWWNEWKPDWVEAIGPMIRCGDAGTVPLTLP